MAAQSPRVESRVATSSLRGDHDVRRLSYRISPSSYLTNFPFAGYA